MWNTRRPLVRPVLGATLLSALAFASNAAGDDKKPLPPPPVGEILSVSMAAGPASYSGPCSPPVRIQLTGKIVTSGPILGMRAQFRFADGTPVGPVQMPIVRRAGEVVVQGTLTRTASWADTIRLHVLFPGPKVSDAVVIKGTCAAPDRGGPAVSLHETVRADGVREERFRVTATGFTVGRQTIESIFETYGVGDEVKLVSWSAECIIGGGSTALPIVRTYAYGDLDGTHDFSRIQAGRGNGRSRGGLMTGDVVPQPGIPQVPGGGPARHTVTEKFPIVLWEGVLREGPGVPNNMVVLLPTLWELDDNPEGDLMPSFGRWANDFPGSYARTLMNEGPWGATTWENIGGLEGNQMYANRWRELTWAAEASRPIGMNGGYATEPGERRQFRDHPAEVYWVPRPLRLTLRTALRASTQPDLAYWINEAPSLGGYYTLHIHFERLR